MTGRALLLLMLLVSWTSLVLQSGALVHLRRQRATYAAEGLAGHGYVRTAACRVLAAAVYSAIALLDIIGVRIPGAGTLGPEALVVFTGIQTLWLFNTVMDIKVRRQLGKSEINSGVVDDRITPG